MQTKICPKCNNEKELIDFNKGRSECRDCSKAYGREYYRREPEKRITKSQKWNEENKERCAELDRKRRSKPEFKAKHAKRERERRKKLKEENPELVKQKENERYQKRKKKLQARARQRRKEDPVFRLRTYVGNSVREALNGKKWGKTWDHLPYTPEELRVHLEAQFEPWMNWDNHGIYDTDTWDDNDETTWTWQMDHIIPHSTFKYETMDCQEFRDCWALSNLRPLIAKVNVKDGSSGVRHK